MTTMLPATESEPVEEAPACLGCGSQRMDWTENGWKCQECGETDGVEMPEPQFTPEQVIEAEVFIYQAVKTLGPISLGRATDLLLDNFSWLQDSVQARHLLIAAMPAIKGN